MKEVKWCPQHGYPEPCVKCHGWTKEAYKEFMESLAEAVGVERKESGREHTKTSSNLTG